MKLENQDQFNDLQSIVAMMASLREMMAMFTPDNEAIVSWTDSNTYKIATEGNAHV